MIKLMNKLLNDADIKVTSCISLQELIAVACSYNVRYKEAVAFAQISQRIEPYELGYTHAAFKN